MEIKNGKWRILIPHTASDTVRCAITDLYGIVDAYLPYPLAVTDEEAAAADTYDENLIIVGTADNGALCKVLAGDGWFVPETAREGYSVRVGDSPYRGGRQLIVLCGADDAGLLYAVHALDRHYLRDAVRYHGYHYNRRHEAFVDVMPHWEEKSAPKIDRRGIWTWGHAIYDYRAYFARMNALGFNHIVIWNDYVPYNAAEVLTEAHRRAISVFWGFSCSWGEEVNPNDPRDTEKWCARVLDVYTREYAPLGGDGIYFQAFTETGNHEIGGKTIASLVTAWANAICGTLHAKYPALEIEFGIHATSIGENYPALSGIDPSVAVMWEDCGDFPYAYDPAKQANAAAALDYTKKLLSLHGADTRFAAVLKGFTVLDWSHFEHYHGPIVMGVSSREFLAKRTEEKRFTWQYARPLWYAGADTLREYCRIVAQSGAAQTTVTALMEDGMFECITDPCAALFAALLWDWDRDPADLIRNAEHAAELYQS
ncbi:MAG: hypothetical protein E7604_00195 [Ruminococcaceae bacterium]|nr:hypothetical protein [Oscillospiraceae bacterium]